MNTRRWEENVLGVLLRFEVALPVILLCDRPALAAPATAALIFCVLNMLAERRALRSSSLRSRCATLAIWAAFNAITVVAIVAPRGDFIVPYHGTSRFEWMKVRSLLGMGAAFWVMITVVRIVVALVFRIGERGEGEMAKKGGRDPLPEE